MKKLLLFSTIAILGLASCSKSDSDYAQQIEGVYKNNLETVTIKRIGSNMVNMVTAVSPFYPGSFPDSHRDSIDVTYSNNIYLLWEAQFNFAQIDGNTLSIITQPSSGGSATFIKQ